MARHLSSAPARADRLRQGDRRPPRDARCSGRRRSPRHRSHQRLLLSLVSLQGISDAVAFGWDARHGGITWADVDASLRLGPSCRRLGSYWRFQSCGYRKGTDTCAEPDHQPRCPLPRHVLRKGGINAAAYSLALFIRDVCGGDLVAWLDASLAQADPGLGAPNRAVTLGTAVVAPLTSVAGTGPKLWSMMLGELLLVGDPNRERWVTAGAGMIALGTLVHNFLHRTGTLHRCGAEHAYGPACYAPGGCAGILRRFADTVDTRQFNPAFPATFPRWIQHAIWRFCTEWGENICNGRQIDDRHRCCRRHCPAFDRCNRISLQGSSLGSVSVRNPRGLTPVAPDSHFVLCRAAGMRDIG